MFKVISKNVNKSLLIKKNVKLMFFFIFIFGLVVFFLYKDIFFLKTRFNLLKCSNFPVEFNGEFVKNNNFVTSGTDAIILSDTSFNVISSNSMKIFDANHNFNSPSLKMNGKYLIGYDLNDFNFKIYSKYREIFSSALNQKIIDADICKNGVYAFLTNSPRSESISQMLVYDKKNNLKYNFDFLNTYPIGISLDPRGNFVSVCSINLKEEQKQNENIINVDSVIHVFDFKNQKLIKDIEIKDCLVKNVYIFNNSNILALSDNSAFFIKKKFSKNDFKTPKKFDFDDLELLCFSIDKNKGVAFSFSPFQDKRCQTIKILNRNGNLISEFETSKILKSICYKKNLIAALSTNMCSIYNISGELKFKKIVSTCAEKIEIISNSYAYILGTGLIDKVCFK